jgi:hypothetical protein
MKTVKAFIEGDFQGHNPGFSVYVDHEDSYLNYGILGDGDTPEQAAVDFLAAYQAMRTYFDEIGKPFAEAFFVFLEDKENFNSPYPLSLPDHILRNELLTHTHKPADQKKQTINRVPAMAL